MNRHLSISNLIESDIPTISSQNKRNKWLISIGKNIRRIDVLGRYTSLDDYDVIPLSRVWDWSADPYEPPMSGMDWWYVIQGMPDSRTKDDFLIELAYGLTGHTGEEYIDDALDQLKNTNLTLTFDTITRTFLLV